MIFVDRIRVELKSTHRNINVKGLKMEIREEMVNTYLEAICLAEENVREGFDEWSRKYGRGGRLEELIETEKK